MGARQLAAAGGDRQHARNLSLQDVQHGRPVGRVLNEGLLHWDSAAPIGGSR